MDSLISCWVQQIFLFYIQNANKQSSMDGEWVLHFEMGNKEIIHTRTNDVQFGHRIRQCAILSHNYRCQLTNDERKLMMLRGLAFNPKILHFSPCLPLFSLNSPSFSSRLPSFSGLSHSPSVYFFCMY